MFSMLSAATAASQLASLLSHVTQPFVKEQEIAVEILFRSIFQRVKSYGMIHCNVLKPLKRFERGETSLKAEINYTGILQILAPAIYLASEIS